MRYYYTQPNTRKMKKVFERSNYEEMVKLAKFVDIIMSQYRLYNHGKGRPMTGGDIYPVL